MILDPGYRLTLRPMKYPQFYEMYRAAIKNTWTVEEVDFATDVNDLAKKMSVADRHLIHRLVAFFATGDTIVGNNLVINLYRAINSPEARMYLSRQLYEEALHVQFYLTLLDTYLPDPAERQAAFEAVETIPSIKRKAEFCQRWINTGESAYRRNELEEELLSPEEIYLHSRRVQLLNLIAFGACIEGIFFFAAFAYVYYLRSRGLLNGLASGTNWVFRDESGHMGFAFEVIRVIREDHPKLFDVSLEQDVVSMVKEAVDCEVQFAQDLLGQGVPGLSVQHMTEYLQYIADQRLVSLGYSKIYNSKNPLQFMELQDVQELTNFFERRPTAYQVGVVGTVKFDEDF